MNLSRKLSRIWAVALILLLAVSLCMAQGEAKKPAHEKMTKKDLPAAVLTNFEKSYPTAGIRRVSTETKEGVKYFEIESQDGKISRNLLYAADGSVKEIEESVPVAQLPEAVKQAVTSSAPKDTLLKAEKVTRDGAVTYEIIVKGAKGRHEVVVSPEGKVIKSEEKGEKAEKAEKMEHKEKAKEPTHK